MASEGEEEEECSDAGIEAASVRLAVN